MTTRSAFTETLTAHVNRYDARPVTIDDVTFQTEAVPDPYDPGPFHALPEVVARVEYRTADGAHGAQAIQLGADEAAALLAAAAADAGVSETAHEDEVQADVAAHERAEASRTDRP